MEDNSAITPGIGICNIGISRVSLVVVSSLDSKDAPHNSKRGIESFLRGATLVLAVNKTGQSE